MEEAAELVDGDTSCNCCLLNGPKVFWMEREVIVDYRTKLDQSTVKIYKNI